VVVVATDLVVIRSDHAISGDDFRRKRKNPDTISGQNDHVEALSSALAAYGKEHSPCDQSK
jgi:hypothetical protein